MARTLADAKIGNFDSLPNKGSSGIYGALAKHLLYPEQLIILCHTVGPGRGSGLDLACVKGNCQVSDGRVLGLS
jgi:hypothetical protein